MARAMISAHARSRTPLPEALRVVVSGMVAGVPGHGGATWSVLQYVLGLRRLGHDVLVIEPVEAVTDAVAEYFEAVIREYDLAERAALLVDGTHQTVGPSYEKAREFARSADILVNVSGMLRDEAFLEPVPTRVYLDLDPGFNQLWHEVEGIDVGFDGHTHFATVGLALGTVGCAVPTCGREWIPTVQPVVLERWPTSDRLAYEGVTTVANWRGYGSIEHEGVFYGQKAHSFRRFIAFPTLTDVPVFLALAIHPDERTDLHALHENGWTLLDADAMAGTPARYRRFVQRSWAELGIAKSGYVESRCGWFSDRSVCYLASGRPVLAQETGFSDVLPVGEGLLAFATMEELLAGLAEVRSDYHRHRRAARVLAEEQFESGRVLTALLDAVAGSRA
jgi:hypothetical protein